MNKSNKKLKQTVDRFIEVNKEYVKATKEERIKLERKWNLWNNKVTKAIAEFDVDKIDYRDTK